MYQLRIYTLKSTEAAQQYLDIWEKHVISLAKFNIKTHAVYLDQETQKQVLALVSYESKQDPASVSKAYMDSPEFRNDMLGFDFSNFIRVEEKNLIESKINSTLE